jgi:hypothetical protein
MPAEEVKERKVEEEDEAEEEVEEDEEGSGEEEEDEEDDADEEDGSCLDYLQLNPHAQAFAGQRPRFPSHHRLTSPDCKLICRTLVAEEDEEEESGEEEEESGEEEGACISPSRDPLYRRTDHRRAE